MNFENTPIIAAVRSGTEFEDAVTSDADKIFLLHTDINRILSQIQLAKQHRKTLFVHLDMMEGIGKDKSGLKFLYQIGIRNIISTKPAIIRTANELGFYTVMRFFAIDSMAIHTALANIEHATPCAVEMMPACLPAVVKALTAELLIPLICGGLITDKESITMLLSKGAKAVSTANRNFWKK